jgi:hypothetical protein
MLVGVIAVFILPDMPHNARGFSKEERELAMQRMVRFSLSFLLPYILSLLRLSHVLHSSPADSLPSHRRLRMLELRTMRRFPLGPPSSSPWATTSSGTWPSRSPRSPSVSRSTSSCASFRCLPFPSLPLFSSSHRPASPPSSLTSLLLLLFLVSLPCTDSYPCQPSTHQDSRLQQHPIPPPLRPSLRLRCYHGLLRLDAL